MGSMVRPGGMITAVTSGLAGSIGTVAPFTVALPWPITSWMVLLSRVTVTICCAWSQLTMAPSGVATYLIGSSVRPSLIIGAVSMLCTWPLTL